MDVLIVGIGCKKCDQLAANTREALDRLCLSEVLIRRVEDVDEIADLGLMLTPVLIVNNMVLTSGKVPSVGQLEKHIKLVMRNKG